jgi:hypothetical protein
MMGWESGLDNLMTGWGSGRGSSPMAKALEVLEGPEGPWWYPRMRQGSRYMPSNGSSHILLVLFALHSCEGVRYAACL